MLERTRSSLATDCIDTIRRLLCRGFFLFDRPGGFAVSFADDEDDVYGFAVPVTWPHPQITLFRGPMSFLGFSAAIEPGPATFAAFLATDILAVGFMPYSRVRSDYRFFLEEGGLTAAPQEVVPYFFAEPPGGERHAPTVEDARHLLACLKALLAAEEMCPLCFLPLGSERGEFPEICALDVSCRPRVLVEPRRYARGRDGAPFPVAGRLPAGKRSPPRARWRQSS